jgi:hypothetical protein
MKTNEEKNEIQKLIKGKMDQNKKCTIDRDELEISSKISGIRIDEILEELFRSRQIDLITSIGTRRDIIVLY